ncbi:class I SAM-dependent methyltransferase [Flagellimonas beolgyonensis]|uniref:class I SAM-dependent methyltransferase n=1 Tax=Flagellimonas beolgyonensis TaxID=864064 RepID=UPI003D6599ED
MEDRKAHWENVYNTKSPKEVSWTQKRPEVSLEFLDSFELPHTTSIIDVGGGDSLLVDFLLEEGFEDITVLDISAKAIEKAKKRLGDRAKNVKWVVSDIVDFKPERNYDVWHDRAAFHFLTEPNQVKSYVDIVNKCVNSYLVIGTFSLDGPKKCSGLDITQYSPESMGSTFTGFNTLNCRTHDHVTPFGTTQNFVFCSFRKII